MSRKIIILHIIDDPKFLPYCKLTFELPEVENIYYSSIDFTSRHSEKAYDIIVFHSLKANGVHIINNIKIKSPIIWFFWGSDGFCLGKFYNLFLLSKTKRSRLKLAFKSGLKKGFKVLFKSCFPKAIDKQLHNRELLKALHEISIIVPIVPGDYKLLKSYYPLRSTCLHLNYVSPVFDSEPSIVNGDNILVGNSAHLSNNHIEIIDSLAKIELRNRQVIIPLSYGDKSNRDYIRKYALRKLPNNVLCLTDFVSFNEYQKVLRSCSVVIMNHLRQQALGNIILSLMMGSKIFLPPSSTLSQFLIENKFLISDINLISINLDQSLTSEEMLHNRNRCYTVFGKENQWEKVKQLIDKALSIPTL